MATETQAVVNEGAACDGEGHPPRAPRVPVDPALLERAAAMFRAAGDPARLRILEHLLSGSCCVSELAEALDEQLSTMSQRLRLLRESRLVSRTRDGKHVYYALADNHVAELIQNVLDHASEV